jgi:hypothetical protein
MTPEAVIELVRVAFRAVPRPAYTLADAAVADEWGDEHYRFEELDQRWEDIPDLYIRRTDSAFCFLPITSWSYYIPAYIVYSIRHATPRRPDTDTSQRLILTLCACAASPGLVEFRRSLTPEQRHAVSSFLSFWRSMYPPEVRELEVREADIVWWDEEGAQPRGCT